MIGRTVQQELDDRGDCRYGLQGVRMRHEPTGRDFVCGGSEWGARGELLVYTRPEQPRPGKSAPAPPPGPHTAEEYAAMTRQELGVYTLQELEDVFQPYAPDEIVRADECVLLSRWPIVCCRPNRRRKFASAART
jgi:hypothetical protein